MNKSKTRCNGITSKGKPCQNIVVSKKNCGKCNKLFGEISEFKPSERTQLKQQLQNYIQQIEDVDVNEQGFQNKETMVIWAKLLLVGEPVKMFAEKNVGTRISDVFNHFSGVSTENKYTLNDLRELSAIMKGGQLDWSTASNPFENNKSFIQRSVFNGTFDEPTWETEMIVEVKTFNQESFFFTMTADKAKASSITKEGLSDSFQDVYDYALEILELKIEDKEKEEKHSWSFDFIIQNRINKGIPVCEADMKQFAEKKL